MVRLHLLGFTPDLKGLVFSGRRGGKAGTYWVPVDKDFEEALEQLEDAREKKRGGKKGRSKKEAEEASPVEEAFPIEEVAPADALQVEASKALAVTDTQDLPLPQTNRVQSDLSPAEVQQLLREGRSVKDVAKRAGVDPEWVERFTGPVLEEKAGVIRMVRDAYQERARLGPSSRPIGDAVVRNLRARKATSDTMAELEEGWDARRVRRGTWVVRLRFYHRGKRRSAEWDFHKDTGEVGPRNKLATELGWWPSDARRVAQRSSTEGTKKGPKKAAKRSTGKKRSTKGRTTTKKRPSSSTSKRSTSKKPASKNKKGTTKKGTTKGRASPKGKRSASSKSSSKKKPPSKRKAPGSSKRSPGGRKGGSSRRS